MRKGRNGVAKREDEAASVDVAAVARANTDERHKGFGGERPGHRFATAMIEPIRQWDRSADRGSRTTATANLDQAAISEIKKQLQATGVPPVAFNLEDAERLHQLGAAIRANALFDCEKWEVLCPAQSMLRNLQEVLLRVTNLFHEAQHAVNAWCVAKRLPDRRHEFSAVELTAIEQRFAAALARLPQGSPRALDPAEIAIADRILDSCKGLQYFVENQMMKMGSQVGMTKAQQHLLYLNNPDEQTAHELQGWMMNSLIEQLGIGDESTGQAVAAERIFPILGLAQSASRGEKKEAVRQVLTQFASLGAAIKEQLTRAFSVPGRSVAPPQPVAEVASPAARVAPPNDMSAAIRMMLIVAWIAVTLGYFLMG